MLFEFEHKAPETFQGLTKHRGWMAVQFTVKSTVISDPFRTGWWFNRIYSTLKINFWVRVTVFEAVAVDILPQKYVTLRR